MERKIKLIWNFYGDDALATAKHHAIHLEEFAKKEQIFSHASGASTVSGGAEAFLIINETDMIAVRDALRPQRGQWVEE
jgi:hypothetical protein